MAPLASLISHSPLASLFLFLAGVYLCFNKHWVSGGLCLLTAGIFGLHYFVS